METRHRPPGRAKGTPKTGGRRKGSLNLVTVEVRAAAAAMVDDPTYRRKLLADLRKRQIAPAVETMLWFYAKGKPKDVIELRGDLDVRFIVRRGAGGALRAWAAKAGPRNTHQGFVPKDIRAQGAGARCRRRSLR